MEYLKDMAVPETVVGYGKGKHIYPLPVGNMEIAKSHAGFGIQLVDVDASALNFALTPRCDKFVKYQDKKYQDKIKQIPIFQNIRYNIAPSTNVVKTLGDLKQACLISVQLSLNTDGMSL